MPVGASALHAAALADPQTAAGPPDGGRRLVRARLDRRDSRHPQRVAELGGTQELRQERRLEYGPVPEVQQLHPCNQRRGRQHVRRARERAELEHVAALNALHQGAPWHP